MWQPHSPDDVDVRFRGACDPADPRALFSHMTLYLYNLTNLDQVRATGAKPHVVRAAAAAFRCRGAGAPERRPWRSRARTCPPVPRRWRD